MKKVFVPFLSIVLMFSCALTATSGLKSKMVGTWQLLNKNTMQVDTLFDGNNQVRYKLITPTNFMVTEVKNDMKVLYGAFFGTYTLEKDVYTEYLNSTGMGYGFYLGQVNRFKVRIKGDLMYIQGIGNPWDEVWKRVAKK